jgi:uncharacterized protein YggE
MKSILKIAAICVAVVLTPSALSQYFNPYMHQQTEAYHLGAVGTAEFDLAPDRAVLIVSVSGSGEDPKDAMVKFRDNARRSLQALKAMPIEGIEVEPGGVGMNYFYDQQELNMMRNNQGGQMPNPRILVAEQYRVVIADIGQYEEKELVEKMQQIVSTVQSLGIGLGPNPAAEMAMYGYGHNSQPQSLFTFETPDAEELVDKARIEAVENATKHAKKVAGVIGAELGPIVAFSETVQTPQPAQPMFNHYRNYPQAAAWQPGGENTMSSPLLGSQTYKVQVSLQFKIEAAEGESE